MLDKSKETKFKKGNQYAWKKGQSGNPSGRPKVRRISDALRDKLPLDGGTGRSQAEGIAENLIRLAQGTGTTAIAAAKEVADRTEGKALQRSALDHRIDRDLFEWKSMKPKDRILVFVPLGDMNPQRLTVSESDKVANVGTGFWSVTMFSTNRKKTVAWSTSKGLYNSNEVRIVLPDKNTAARFERALGDAIKLCGGKPDTPEPY